MAITIPASPGTEGAPAGGASFRGRVLRFNTALAFVAVRALVAIGVVVGEAARHGVGEALDDRAAEPPAGGLDAFHGAQVGGGHQ